MKEGKGLFFPNRIVQIITLSKNEWEGEKGKRKTEKEREKERKIEREREREKGRGWVKKRMNDERMKKTRIPAPLSQSHPYTESLVVFCVFFFTFIHLLGPPMMWVPLNGWTPRYATDQRTKYILLFIDSDTSWPESLLGSTLSDAQTYYNQDDLQFDPYSYVTQSPH